MYQAKQSKQTSYCNFVQLKKSASFEAANNENIFPNKWIRVFSEEQKLKNKTSVLESTRKLCFARIKKQLPVFVEGTWQYRAWSIEYLR